jgi:hypothetical protein
MMFFPGGTTFTPYSVLRNISDTPLTVTPTVWWMAGGSAQSAPLQGLTLAPSQSQSLDVKALISAAGLGNFNGSVNLEFNVQGKEGGLLLQGGSVDQTNTYVFEVNPRGVFDSGSKSLGYWSTANGDDTMVTLWNPADEAQDLVFRVVFSGGHYLLPMHFGPRETHGFNMSEIIRNQVPDVEGNIIPATVQEGSATISGSHEVAEHILVAVDVGIYNVHKATCGGGCVYCDGYTSFGGLYPGSGAFAVQHTKQYQALGTWSSGVQYNVANSWSSSQPTIAAVNSNGVATGMSVGVAQFSAPYGPDPVYTGEMCFSGGSPFCPAPPASGTMGGTGNVNFAVYGISPASGVAGTTAVNVTISGSGFRIPCGNCVTVTGGITVAGATTSSDGTQISAVFGLTSASQGVQTVTVTGPTVDGNTPSGSVNFGVASAVCPSTISVPNVTQLDMKNQFFPLGFLTGMGAVATMVVGPSSTSWDGVAISESVSPVSSTCPAQVPSAAALCTGSGSFDVDGTYSYFVPPLPAPFGPTHNTFYDIHWGPDGKFSALGPNDPNSCTVVCTQQYSCNGSALGSAFTITRTLTKSTAGPGNTPITLVTVTKQ